MSDIPMQKQLDNKSLAVYENVGPSSDGHPLHTNTNMPTYACLNHNNLPPKSHALSTFWKKKNPPRRGLLRSHALT